MSNEASFWEHVAEFRRRLIWTGAVFLASLAAGLFLAEPMLHYLKRTPPADSISWHAFSPWDAIGIYMKFGMGLGLAMTLPFALYQLWSFVKPGLHIEEQRATRRYIPAAVLLFFIGLSFGYFVIFPMAFYFTSEVTKGLELEQTYGIAQYFSFLFNIILPMALMFELPIVVLFLTRLRLLNPLRLRKLRRFAYVGLIVVATLMTPPDFVSDILVYIPLIALYEVSLLLSRSAYRKQQREDRKREASHRPVGDGM